MKTIIKEKKKLKQLQFPCLMKYNRGDDNFIVLFTSKDCGTVVSENESWDLGEFKDSWEIEYFIPFQGEIILSND